MNSYLAAFFFVLALITFLLYKRHKKMRVLYIKKIKLDSSELKPPEDNEYGKVIKFPGPEERRKIRKLNAWKTKDP